MIRKPEKMNLTYFTQDELCYHCEKVFSCQEAFKVTSCPHLPYRRAWGHCKHCGRIVSPFHSNCPSCGQHEIIPSLFEEINKRQQEQKGGV